MGLKTVAEYLESLRKMRSRVFVLGEEITNPLDHPVIRPSINSVAETYRMAEEPAYRDLEGMDKGNVHCGKYTSLVLFNDLLVPWERVFMTGETEFSGTLVHRFAACHRQSHGGCKSGVGDVLIGAAQTIAEYNGISTASHVREKITDMIHMTETMYACSLAASYEGVKAPPASIP